MNNGDTLEMYINSPGGSVFTTQGIVNMINRCKKTKNIKVVSYIDGDTLTMQTYAIDNIY